MSSFDPRDLQAALLAVRRRLMAADDLGAALLEADETAGSLASVLRRRLGEQVWSSLRQEDSLPAETPMPPSLPPMEGAPSTIPPSGAGSVATPPAGPCRYLRGPLHA